MCKRDDFFRQLEACGNPGLILFRSIELKLVKERMDRLGWKKCLDLGCGNGLVAKVIFKSKVNYGLDCDKRALKMAKRAGVYKQLLLAEAEKTPLENGAVDLVFSNCVVEHILEIEEVFKEVGRVLKKNGYFVFTSLTDNFADYSIFSFLKWGRMREKYGKFRDRKLQHYHGYSIQEWRKLLKKQGLVVVDNFYYLPSKTVELWDFLMLWSHFLAKVSVKLNWWLYEKLWKQMIYRQYKLTKSVGSQGGAIGIVAQKI